MTNRITKTTLQNQLDRLNAKLHEVSHMELDFYRHASPLGSYRLIYYKGLHPATPRMTGKEMHQYLNGALDWVTSDK
tara:strand:- start:416 stop:646 length:231 start_codon:yes stop_codon:yes gene_type:complete